MNPLLASARLGSGLDLVDVPFFPSEEEWQRQGEVRLEQFWPDRCRAEGIDPGDSITVLAELIKADLRARFDGGQVPRLPATSNNSPSSARRIAAC